MNQFLCSHAHVLLDSSPPYEFSVTCNTHMVLTHTRQSRSQQSWVSEVTSLTASGPAKVPRQRGGSSVAFCTGLKVNRMGARPQQVPVLILHLLHSYTPGWTPLGGSRSRTLFLSFLPTKQESLQLQQHRANVQEHPQQAMCLFEKCRFLECSAEASLFSLPSLPYLTSRFSKSGHIRWASRSY